MTTIRATCDHCGKAYKLPEAARGRMAKCKACGEGFRVPASMDDPPPMSYDDLFGADAASVSCPSCQAQVGPDAKHCVACGFDLLRQGQLTSAKPYGDRVRASAPPATFSEDSFIANLQQRKVTHHVMLGFVVMVAVGFLYLTVMLDPPLKGETDWVKIILVGAGTGLLLLCGLALTVMYMPSSSSSWNVRVAKLVFGGLGLAIGSGAALVTLFAAMKQNNTVDGRPVYLLLVGGFVAVFFFAISIKTLVAGMTGRAG